MLPACIDIQSVRAVSDWIETAGSYKNKYNLIHGLMIPFIEVSHLVQKDFAGFIEKVGLLSFISGERFELFEYVRLS